MQMMSVELKPEQKSAIAEMKLEIMRRNNKQTATKNAAKESETQSKEAEAEAEASTKKEEAKTPQPSEKEDKGTTDKKQQNRKLEETAKKSNASSSDEEEAKNVEPAPKRSRTSTVPGVDEDVTLDCVEQESKAATNQTQSKAAAPGTDAEQAAAAAAAATQTATPSESTKTLEKEKEPAVAAATDKAEGQKSIIPALQVLEERSALDEAFRRKFMESVDQNERRFARLVAFHPPVTLALLNRDPLVCGREPLRDGSNFLAIGDITPHKRAVSRRHFSINYDKATAKFYLKVLSQNGLMLNTQLLLAGTHPLTSGARIVVQHFVMYFEVPENFTPPATD